MKQLEGVFDHPFVPALIIIAWAIGMVMGMILITTLWNY